MARNLCAAVFAQIDFAAADAERINHAIAKPLADSLHGNAVLIAALMLGADFTFCGGAPGALIAILLVVDGVMALVVLSRGTAPPDALDRLRAEVIV